MSGNPTKAKAAAAKELARQQNPSSVKVQGRDGGREYESTCEHESAHTPRRLWQLVTPDGEVVQRSEAFLDETSRHSDAKREDRPMQGSPRGRSDK
jgi:hypothetical protein